MRDTTPGGAEAAEERQRNDEKRRFSRRLLCVLSFSARGAQLLRGERPSYLDNA